MKARRRQAGFTLIEIVVAFVMLALVLGVSYEVFATGMRRASDLEDYSKALAIAQSQIAQASIGDTFEEGQASGESPDRRFRWTTTISGYLEGRDNPQAQVNAFDPIRIAVRVSWRSGAEQERQLDLATLVVGKLS